LHYPVVGNFASWKHGRLGVKDGWERLVDDRRDRLDHWSLSVLGAMRGRRRSVGCLRQIAVVGMVEL